MRTKKSKKARSFKTLSQAEEENGQSRIYLGIHWSYDKVEGIRAGRRVAELIKARLFTRRAGRPGVATVEVDPLQGDQ